MFSLNMVDNPMYPLLLSFILKSYGVGGWPSGIKCHPQSRQYLLELD